MRDRNRFERKFEKIVKGLLIAIVAVAVFGFVVKGLWNWLLPPLFGWHAITFWQAIGLLVLSKILFGKFSGGPGRGMRWRGRMSEKWEQMSPEEREKFREGVRGRFGRRGCWPDAGKAEI
jgi:hypothetical protein